ncbi:glycosyltransferase family 2 protein [Desulfovibrio inopinatus]|uniref:glycosyltransferase family 2 protein n=1 Tax=Desulfovibrio inopinatus TaxID=102109 RepID=UPI000487B15A|nr:glycosyltransferase family 2 protein [Desulfovibrio inopinatus]
MKKPYLSIIIPVLNLWHFTADCLKSLKANTPGSFYEVLVVDNGSSDSTPSECPHLGKQLFDERFTYIRLEENIHFGPACNLGASKAAGEILFFLNNDTLLTKNWFSPLFDLFRYDVTVMAASPLCLFPDDGRIQHMGIGYTGTLGVRHPYFLFPGDHVVTQKNRKFQALSAATLMVPATVFKKLEGFFPEYANGFEDMDLCCRMRRAGGRLVQENRSKVYHWSSKTPGRNRFDSENMKLLNARCVGCFKPDFHRIVYDDGFICTLTPWLEMVMREENETLFKTLDTLTTEDEIRSALESYPLWENGYDVLAAMLQAQHRLEEAAQTIFYGAVFFPNIKRFQRLKSLAEITHNEAWITQAERRLEGIMNALSSPDQLYAQAEYILRWSQDNNDRILQTLYQEWINAHRHTQKRV